jgi:VCBS repeat-containing protein
MSKNIFAPSTGLQLSNSAQSQIASKPQRSESITFELNGDGARLDLAAVVQAAPFEALASVTEAQPTPSDADRILPSAAAFHDASIDALQHGLVPLALLGQEGKNGNLFASVHSLTSHQNAVLATPTVTVPPPGGSATTVFEAGLGPRNGEPPGTHAGQPAFPTTTKTGAISFSSDGVQSVSLGGHLLSSTPQTFADGTTGTLTASYTFNAATGKGTITYTYKLLDNTAGIPSTSFAVVVTDADGGTNPPASLVIKIMDDAPVARADTDTLTPGLTTADGNVLTGVGTTSGIADMQGADGGVTVVGVAAGSGPGGAAPGTVGVAIVGARGTLTLNADGSYTYVATGGGGGDVFTYTIRDADGSLSSATLTINLGDAAPGNIVIPPANTPGQTQVFEAGLGARGVEPAGSHAGNPSFPSTTSGTISFTSPDGVSKVELGGLTLTVSGTQQTITDATGRLTASFTYNPATGQGTITYTYTLLDNTIGTPSVSFAVAVTDADGDRTPGGNLTISILDDAPIAIADTDAVAAGQLTAESGNVLTGTGTTSGTAGANVRGADGAVVAGVAVGNTGTSLVNAGTVGVAIAGAFGTLTLNADGSYSYSHTGAPGGGTDTFTYTIRDADGSLSNATLTIAVADSTPGGIVIPPTNTPGQTQVFEAGLGARGVEPAGSHAGDPSFPSTTSGTISFTSPAVRFKTPWRHRAGHDRANATFENVMAGLVPAIHVLILARS